MIDNQQLKSRAISGVFWSFIERFGTLLILFVANVVLARLLTPQDYGLIGMITVFVMLSNVLVDSGLGAALIQKTTPTHIDYSTIFFFNIILSFLLYGLLFIFSGNIADFYSQPLLSPMLKVLGLVVIIDALAAVQNNILVKKLNFRKISLIKISVAIVASIVAIISALSGLGVWSLVIQSLTNSILRSCILWVSSTWTPSWIFSVDSFKSLFGYSSKLLCASMLSEGYRNLQLLIIGRHFPASEVGYFSQAKQLENVPVSSLVAIVNQVTFPVFSELQTKRDSLLRGLRRCFKLLAYINFPLMVFLTIIARPLIHILYSDKWLPVVPYFQWLCMGFGFLLVIHNANLNALKAIGQSGAVLKLEILKKIIGISLIFILLDYGVYGILWALTINSVLEFIFNAYYTGKYLSYGFIKQFEDILPIALMALISGLLSYLFAFIVTMPSGVMIIVQFLIYISCYLFGSYIFHFEIAKFLLDEIKKYVQR